MFGVRTGPPAQDLRDLWAYQTRAHWTSSLIDSVINLCAFQFFCVVAVVAYGVDVFYQVRDIRSKFAARQQRDGEGPPVTQ